MTHISSLNLIVLCHKWTNIQMPYFFSDTPLSIHIPLPPSTHIFPHNFLWLVTCNLKSTTSFLLWTYLWAYQAIPPNVLFPKTCLHQTSFYIHCHQRYSYLTFFKSLFKYSFSMKPAQITSFSFSCLNTILLLYFLNLCILFYSINNIIYLVQVRFLHCF